MEKLTVHQSSASRGNVDLRQTYCFADSVRDSESRGVQLCVRRVQAKDAIEAEPGLVNHRGAEGMYFVERQKLPQRVVIVSKTWNRITETAGLAETSGLRRIVTM
jgi:hypothetical protein